MKTYNREEWTTLVVFLQVGTIQVLGKQWAPGCDSLGLNRTSSTTDKDRALGLLREEWALVGIGNIGLKKTC